MQTAGRYSYAYGRSGDRKPPRLRNMHGVYTLTIHISSLKYVKTMTDKFCGEVVLTGSPNYHGARQEFNRSIRKYPAAIVYCCNERDIIEALGYAKEKRLDAPKV